MICRVALLTVCIALTALAARAQTTGVSVLLGGEGFDLEHDAARSVLYASVPSLNQVVRISTRSYTVIDRITVGPRPMGLDLSHDGRHLFIALGGAGSVGVLDLETRALSTISVRDALGSRNSFDVLEAQPGRIFVTARADPRESTYVAELMLGPPVSVVRVASGQSIGVQPTLHANPAGTRVRVADGPRLYEFDLTAPTTALIREVAVPLGGTQVLGQSPDGRRLITAAGQVLDGTTLAEIGRIDPSIPFFAEGSAVIFAALPRIPNSLARFDTATLAKLGEASLPCSIGIIRRAIALDGGARVFTLGLDRVCAALPAPVCSSPPSEPVAPLPADSATGVSRRVLLGWMTSEGDCLTRQGVLLDTASPPTRIRCSLAGSERSCDLGGLAPDTTYYWQVVTTNAEGVTEGPIWSFTTGSEFPSAPNYSGIDIQLGARAQDMELDELRNLIYVSVPSLQQIQVYSASSYRLLRRIQLRSPPLGIDLGLDGSKLFAVLGTRVYGSSFEGALAVIDLVTGAIAEIDVEEVLGDRRPFDVLEAQHQRLFVTGDPQSSGSAYVTQIRLDQANAMSRVASNRIIRFAPLLEVSPNLRSLFVTGGDGVFRLDLDQASAPIVGGSDNSPFILPVGTGLTLSPDGRRIYSSTGTVVDATTFNTLGSIGQGIPQPERSGALVSVAIAPDQIEVYDSTRFEKLASHSLACSLSNVRDLHVLPRQSGWLVLADDRLCGLTSDRDRDAVGDATDNCPQLENTDQADDDGDGAGDACDRCPGLANITQTDTDADGIGDACDPFPGHALAVRPRVSGTTLSGAPISITYELVDRRSDALVTDLQGVRATLTLGGSARFGTQASRGTLIAGGDTARALVEFDGGLVSLTMRDDVEEVVDLGVENTQPNGVILRTDVFEDFEDEEHGFSATLPWRLGTPTVGPAAAFSGQRLWGNGLDSRVPPQTSGSLISPVYALAASSHPELRVQSWLDMGASSTDGNDIAISVDGGVTWSELVQIIQFNLPRARYFPIGVDLSAYAGQNIRIRFRNYLTYSSEPVGWYLDDFELLDPGSAIDFLRPEGDADSDGLTNAEELALGSEPRRSDTDVDGIADGPDNCRFVPNQPQLDFVHPNGVGDACEDADGDGDADAVDNCPDHPNGSQSDLDSDGHGDACDAYPDAWLEVRPVRQEGLAGQPILAEYALVEVRSGSLRADLVGVRVSLNVSGSARFADQATHGQVLAGGGTSQVLAEFSGGYFRIPVHDAVAEVVTLGGTDSEELGIAIRADRIQDFERGEGGFAPDSVYGGSWEYGIPSSGPSAAYSGLRVWGTNLDGSYLPESTSILTSAPISLPGDSTPTLELRSWLDAQGLGGPPASISVIESNGVGSTTQLAMLSGSGEGWQTLRHDLASFAGKNIRIRFYFQAGREARPGWYIDDFAILGLSPTLDFLAPDGDADADGLSNGAELALGTRPRDPDSDDDEALDGADNCPRTANPTQLDAVHPGGAGDACDDPDADGAMDLTDNCPDVPNNQFNADGDRHGDACDAYPDAILRVRPVTSGFILTGQPGFISYRLEDRRDGRMHSALQGVRVSLTLGGSAVFGATASRGNLLAGAGTNRALVEFVDGLVTVEVRDSVQETADLGLIDTSSLDVDFRADFFEDFEAGDGGFTHSGPGDSWKHGTRIRGPVQGASGSYIWATGLDGDYLPNGDAALLSRVFHVPGNARPLLQLTHYRGLVSGDVAHLELRRGDLDGWTELPLLGGYWGEYHQHSYDLSALAGRELQFRFRLTSDYASQALGWYIDDFLLGGIRPAIDFLSGAQDADEDRLSNATELARGSNPFLVDTDADNVSDRNDNCPLTPNRDQLDLTHPNGVGDACDDPDADGRPDSHDNCAEVPNPDQRDAVHPGGAGDACDDPDGDGVPDSHDNCADHPNSGQPDRDADLVGDACDLCPNVDNPDQDEPAACIELASDGGECLRARVDLVEALGGALHVSRSAIVSPTEVRLEAVATSCSGSNNQIELLLNGSSLGVLPLPASCNCASPVWSAVFDDPVLLESLWNPAGPNELRIRKPTSGARVVWIQVEISSPAAPLGICAVDAASSACSRNTSGCVWFFPTTSEVSVPITDPLVATETIRSLGYAGADLPGSIDLSALSASEADLCVSARQPPALLTHQLDGRLAWLDPATGKVRQVGSLASAVSDLEHDEVAREGIAVDGIYLLRFEIPTGRVLRAVRLDAWLNALEYVGSTLYGVTQPPAQLRTLSPDTGVSQLIGPTGHYLIMELARDPATGILYGVDGDQMNLVRFDLASGAASVIAPLAFTPSALEFGPDGRLYALSSGPSPALHRIDPSTGSSESIAPLAQASRGLTLVVDPSETDCARFDHADEGGIAINGAPCVAIDVEPGHAANPIQPLRVGTIPVAILGSDELDVQSVDPASLRFGPYSTRLAPGTSARVQDVDGDQRPDLLAEFRTLQTGIAFDSERACLTGSTFGGPHFDKCDAIEIVYAPGEPGDADGDGLPDETDNCPWYATSALVDADENGIGDACECGDQTGDGRVTVADIVAINAAIFTPQTATALCDTNLDETCDVMDLIGARLRIFGRPAHCARHPWPSP